MNDFIVWIDSLPALVQFVLIFVVGIIPFLESYVAAPVGILLGLPWPLALGAAIAGNVLALLVAVPWGAKLADKREGQPRSPRQEKVVARVNKYGVPVAALIAPTLMAISLTAFFMVLAGLDRKQTMIWNVVASVVWGAGFAVLAIIAVDVIFNA